MRKIYLGQTITILANVGVIAGIVFLAVELQQNNELLEAEARQALVDRRISLAGMVASNDELANVVAKAQAGEEALSPGERRQLYALNVSIFAMVESQFAEYQRGRLELEDVTVGGLTNALSDSGLSGNVLEFWETWKHTTNPDFREFVEEQAIEKTR